MTYSTSNGNTFTVGNGEEIGASIDPQESCWLTVGATGTKDFEMTDYIDKKSAYGITISTDTPGGYRIYAQNDNDYTITVSGVVNISKV